MNWIILGEFAIILLIAGIHILSMSAWNKERRDLLNRLMARDYTEYTLTGKPPPKVRNFVTVGLKRHYKEGE